MKQDSISYIRTPVVIVRFDSLRQLSLLEAFFFVSNSGSLIFTRRLPEDFLIKQNTAPTPLLRFKLVQETWKPGSQRNEKQWDPFLDAYAEFLR